jgi:hypothetical protein
MSFQERKWLMTIYTRRDFLKAAGVGSVSFLLHDHRAHAERNKQKPNILVIMSDEHNAGVLGCYGNDIVKTVNLDGLAARGVTFENCYCNSPLCVPSLHFVFPRACRLLPVNTLPGSGPGIMDAGCPLRITRHYREL